MECKCLPENGWPLFWAQHSKTPIKTCGTCFVISITHRSPLLRYLLVSTTRGRCTVLTLLSTCVDHVLTSWSILRMQYGTRSQCTWCCVGKHAISVRRHLCFTLSSPRLLQGDVFSFQDAFKSSGNSHILFWCTSLSMWTSGSINTQTPPNSLPTSANNRTNARILS